MADAEVFDKTRETDRVFFELQVMLKQALARGNPNNHTCF